MDHIPRAPRACDACKRRKVKCSGKPSCEQCTHLNLKCHYAEAIPASRSRKSIVRGGVIDAYKGGSCRSQGLVPLQPAPLEALQVSHQESQFSYPSAFPIDFFAALVADYSACVFPFLPIIPDSDFRSAFSEPEMNREDHAFIHALGAVIVNMTRVGPRHAPNNFDQVVLLYTKALEFRGTIMPDNLITTKSIMIPLLISICLFASRRNTDMGFYYLREAITRIQILQVNESAKVDILSAKERAQRGRLYWLLFVHERFVAICYYRNTILPPLHNLPEKDSAIGKGVLEGFDQVIRLFRVIDEKFIRHWFDRKSSSMTLAWIEKKQVELGDDMDVWENEIRCLTEMQQIDLIVTRHWLHTLLWQMALSKLLLTSIVDEEREFMSILFPIRLSHRLRSILATMPRKAVEIHGTGIIQKIFDITDTIADILVHVPAATTDNQISMDHLNDFLFLYRLLLSLSKFYPVEEAVLRAKLETLRSQFPSFRNTVD